MSTVEVVNETRLSPWQRAEWRARSLLLSMLTPVQREQFELHGAFVVVGSLGDPFLVCDHRRIDSPWNVSARPDVIAASRVRHHPHSFFTLFFGCPWCERERRDLRQMAAPYGGSLGLCMTRKLSPVFGEAIPLHDLLLAQKLLLETDQAYYINEACVAGITRTQTHLMERLIA